MRPALPSHLTAPCDQLLDDLRACFGRRLQALVAYGPCLFPNRAHRSHRVALNTLALVDSLTLADLETMSGRAEGWDRAGLAMPLVLSRDEFARSLDAFPVEYGNIIAHHVVISGDDPFQGLAVQQSDLRRTCETLAKSHLIHLREAYLETRGRPAELAVVIRDSARPFAAFLGALSVLLGETADGVADLAAVAARHAGVSASVVSQVLESIFTQELSNDEARRLYPDYLAVVERLVSYVDQFGR